MTTADHCRRWLQRLGTAALRLSPRSVRFMEVCGTHTVSAFRCGLHSLLPENVQLLSGPGCPVCVTAQGDIDQLVDLAALPEVTVCTYGDMMRVTGARGSLELARCGGADVRVVYSALDAVRIAAASPRRQVVFAAVGFETTAPASAAAVLEADQQGLANFSILASHKLILPALRALLDSRQTRVDGFMCPGHVSVVLGSEAFREIVQDYRLPCVIAGFEPPHLAAAVARLAELVAEGTPALENLYPDAVAPRGNRMAQIVMGRVFERTDVRWRALGQIVGSGLALRPQYTRFDARGRFNLEDVESPEPAGCRCDEVITARCTPIDCNLFGRVCTPVYPVGPCMISSEGTCQAWFKYRRRGTPARPKEEAAT